jgi:hypothetical protein
VTVSNMGDKVVETDIKGKTRWQKVREVIWDGPRPEEERKLVQRLDLFLLYGALRELRHCG